MSDLANRLRGQYITWAKAEGLSEAEFIKGLVETISAVADMEFDAGGHSSTWWAFECDTGSFKITVDKIAPPIETASEETVVDSTN